MIKYNRLIRLFLIGVFGFWIATHARAQDESLGIWVPTEWEGEAAFTLSTDQWVAIVSMERARLIHFGKNKNSDSNWLWAPERGRQFGWGGHVVWLGPQSGWGWPPPKAWDGSAAEDVLVEGARLSLQLSDAGDEWPRVTRVYELVDSKLACRIEFEGGSRVAQAIHIFQTRKDAIAKARILQSQGEGRGMAQVPMYRRSEVIYDFELPDNIEVQGEQVLFRYSGEDEKLGFHPQDLISDLQNERLLVGRGLQQSNNAGSPDDGLFTQVYLGHPGWATIELEQLGPLHAPGDRAICEALLWIETIDLE